MSFDPVKNFARVLVSGGYNAGATEITLVTTEGAKLPDPAVLGQYNLPWWNATDYGDATADPLREIVRVTAKTGDVITVVRAQELTTATAHNLPGKTYKMEVAWTEKLYNDLIAAQVDVTNDILDGATSFKRVSIPGITEDSEVNYCWGKHDHTLPPTENFSRPIGSLFHSEIGDGYIDIRSTAFEVRNRRIKVWVRK